MLSKKRSLSSIQDTTKDLLEYHIPPTRRTPEVKIDNKEGIISVKGRSLPVRANDFYFPVLRKIEEYIENPNPNTKVIFNLEYVDSASSKLLLALIMRLRKIKEKSDLNIRWSYSDEDHDIIELGQYFSDLSGVEIFYDNES